MTRRRHRRLGAAREAGREPGHIACLPGRPGAPAQLGTIAAALGCELTGDPDRAEAIVFWQEDPASAFHEPTAELLAISIERPVVNIGCTDVSKTTVARTFESISGTPFLVDPETHSGLAVEKPEGNGLRGGRIVECPTGRVAGFSYQHLIDNLNQTGDRAVDIRPAIFGDEIPYAIYKERFLDNRLGTVLQPEIVPRLERVDELMSEEEQKMVLELSRRLGADWCEIDCCRDRETGILYPVDVNTTPSYFTAFETEPFEELVRIQAEAFERVFIRADQTADRDAPKESPVTDSMSASIPGSSRSAE